MATVFQGLPNEDFGEFYENYETLATLKNWNERQRKAGLILYTAGPAKLFLKTIDATTMTYDEIIKEFNEKFKCELERVASGSCAGGDWQPCLSDLIESANNAACVETARVRVQPDVTRVCNLMTDVFPALTPSVRAHRHRLSIVQSVGRAIWCDKQREVVLVVFWSAFKRYNKMCPIRRRRDFDADADGNEIPVDVDNVTILNNQLEATPILRDAPVADTLSRMGFEPLGLKILCRFINISKSITDVTSQARTPLMNLSSNEMLSRQIGVPKLPVQHIVQREPQASCSSHPGKYS
ncbi:hypothetical protein EVAR_30721_1 [Eumeta japonica]|uniref:Uncharacterized protein n=1 Tax=Eumeta variegata TaxID=151549 RepID=A0A4C1V6B4_EUMVA|nr:hypothetical protein EVAR_30721_1 [Eumeta japonica]